VPEWLTIEVFDGEVPASGWRRAHEDDLIEAAVTNGASFWDWHTTRWGVVLELLFDTDERLERFRHLSPVPPRCPSPSRTRSSGSGEGSRRRSRVSRWPSWDSRATGVPRAQ
jgi:hypothetical protein